MAVQVQKPDYEAANPISGQGIRAAHALEPRSFFIDSLSNGSVGPEEEPIVSETMADENIHKFIKKTALPKAMDLAAQGQLFSAVFHQE